MQTISRYDRVRHELRQFLKRYDAKRAPLVVGWSGGADSTALLYALLEEGVRPHAVHVDHGWRQTSAEEAERLRQEASSLKIPFWAFRLQMAAGSNLEDRARRERWRRFSQVYTETGAGLLLLAHHANDQAETVLKRLCEGSHFLFSGGMRPLSTLAEMRVGRPFLKVSKREIVQWLQRRDLAFLEDETNRDTRFQRARMREHILPELTARFGKEVQGNLVRWGESACELREYFERRTAPFYERLERSAAGIRLDVNPFYPIEKLELKTFLRLSFSEEEIGLSRDTLEALACHLARRGTRRRFAARGWVLHSHLGVMEAVRV
jgi:tRNA(Ile)-lysidine synthase